MLIRCLTLTLALLAFLPRPVAAQLDALTNVASCVVTGFAAAATSVTVNTGCGATLPAVSFNASVCNTTDYPVSCRTTAGVIDPNYEVVRVTARATDTLTITRAQEGTADVAHNTGAKVYWLSTFTAKTVTDINTALGATFLTTSTNSVLTNEAVLAGTANQVILTGSTLSTPQNIATTSAVQFGSVAISTSGGIFVRNGVTTEYHPEGQAADKGLARWHNNLGLGGSTTKTQTIATLFGQAGPDSIQGANYYNPVFRLSARDTAGGEVSAYEMSAEGNVLAGTFSQQRWYLYQYGLTGGVGENIAYIDRTDHLKFKFQSPDVTAGYLGVGVQIGGNTVTTQADGWVGGLLVGPGSYKKNDTNTRSLPWVQIKPTFAFGASNTNTTVNILEIDSTNTTTTGLTANLFKASYGGTQRAILTSAGKLRIGTGTPTHQYDQLAAVSDFAAGSYSIGGSQYTAAFLKATLDQTIPDNTRTFTVDSIYNPTTATDIVNAAIFGIASVPSGNTQTLTLTSLRGVNGYGYTAGSGAVGEITGGLYIGQNAGTGTTTDLSSVWSQIATTNASAVVTNAYGFRVTMPANSGTMTDTYGFHVGDITSGTQTNQAWSFYGSDANSRSYLNHSLDIGGTANRGTTEGTNQLKVFNGTAPVGTLTNGVSLYSTSGELRVMDSAGNATLLSPHDDETGEWITFMQNTVTGRVLRVDMEALVNWLFTLQ